MTPLSPPLGNGEVRFWRLDADHFASGWAQGEGSFRAGGRWNSAGVRAVYAALDPATATMEMAVHKGFLILDTQPHTLTSACVIKAKMIAVIRPEDLPNPNWLTPGTPNRNQRMFGDALLAQHRFVLIPSAVSRHSWNLIFDAAKPVSDYGDVTQERFALDPRLQAAGG